MAPPNENETRFGGKPFEPFGPGAKLDHAGIAVSSIMDTPGQHEVTHDPVQRVKLAFLKLHDAPIELVEAVDENSPVTKLLQAGNHLYHLCFSVPDLEVAVKEAKRHGFHRLGKPIPAPALGGRCIVWLFSKQYGLYELVEAQKNSHGS